MPHSAMGRRRVVVCGMVAGIPDQGGWVWAVMNWVQGLRRLGHDVVLLEPVDRLDPAVQAAFADLAGRFGLTGKAAMVAPGRRSAGLCYREVADLIAESDVLLNLGGALADPELFERLPVRVYLDLDPAFTQLWSEVCGIDMHLKGHSHFVTVGLNVGRPDCPVPTCGREWIPTLPPVDLASWSLADQDCSGGWTTVANWRGYGSVEHQGIRYGQKVHSWRQFMQLPELVDERIAPALAIHPEEGPDLDALVRYGWQIVDPIEVCATPDAYRQYVGRSLGELSVAKEGYVVSRCGWFSDRSACFLAAGRPVVAQDTGWADRLPATEGLVAFTSVEEAADAMNKVRRDYARHRRAARRFAQEMLDSVRVIDDLMEVLGS